MKAYRPHTPASRFTRRHTWVAVLALLAIGGGTLAATGGAEKLTKWIYVSVVRIQLDEEEVEFVTDEDGTGFFTFETEDGGQAEVQVQTEILPGEGDTRTIQISMAGAEGERTEDVAVERRCIRLDGETPAPDQTYTLDDVGDADPVLEWEDGEVLEAVYLVPKAEDEGDGFKVFLATTDAEDQTTVQLLCAPPVPLPEDEEDLDVELGEDGVLTIGVATPDGQQMMLKLKIAAAADTEECGPETPLSVSTPDGEIQITVETVAIEEAE